MSEQIDELINTLNLLKSEKQNLIEENSESLKRLTIGKDKVKDSSQKIINYLEMIQNEMKICEESQKDFLNTLNNKKVSKTKTSKTIKKFRFIESNLTELMTKDSYQTIYNIFLSFLFFLMGIFVMSEFIEKQENINFSVFITSFKGIKRYMLQWVTKIFISITMVVFIHILKDICHRTVSSVIFYLFTILIMYSFKHIFTTDDMSLLFKFVHFCDNTNLILKLIAYYMEKVSRVTYELSKLELDKQDNGRESILDKTSSCESNLLINKKENEMSLILRDNGHDDVIHFEFKKLNLGKEIKNYLYFYFAPTLVYRDSYPMKSSINFRIIVQHFTNTFLCYIFFILIFETEINPMFSDIRVYSDYSFMQTLVSFIMFSLMLFFMLFFGVAHSLLNLYSELTRFGDRRFYGCFYSSKSPIRFYQKLTMYYEDFLQSYFRPFYGDFIYNLIRILVLCFVADYILLFATGLSTPYVSVIIVLTHLLSLPFKYFKTEKRVLVNWLIMSLGMGLIVMVNYLDYYIDGNDNSTCLIHKAMCLFSHKLY